MSKTYLVGGAVRDMVLNRPAHDWDYVVVGSTIEEMLEKGFKQVSKGFPVFIHPETGDEYALARKEIKTGDKHTDFEFVFTPDTSLYEDMQRRDFTINAMAVDTETEELIDYFNGIADIKFKNIRHVDSEHFIEDPLRILRAIRFKCQLDGFTISPETLHLLIDMVKQGMLLHLTPERVWKEMEKALCTTRFDEFIETLYYIDGLIKLLPEVFYLHHVPEKIEYHPEGNTYSHLLLTLQCVNRLDKDVDINLINFGLLCHDLGKLDTQECWPSHHGHEDNRQHIKDICERFKIPNEYVKFAMLATKYHMDFYKFLEMHVKRQYDKVKEMSDGFKNYRQLCNIIALHYCDLNGRKGQIAQERIDTFYKVQERCQQIYNIMHGVTLKDLPKEAQKQLSKLKGQKFGQRYREAMISYLKYNLKK